MRLRLLSALLVITLSACDSNDDSASGDEDGGGERRASTAVRRRTAARRRAARREGGRRGRERRARAAPIRAIAHGSGVQALRQAENTFTLPFPEDGALYHPDLAGDFPDVDFATLDRLYIPAGSTGASCSAVSRSATRSAARRHESGWAGEGGRRRRQYVFVMQGGTNWILTGRYDPDSRDGRRRLPRPRRGSSRTLKAPTGSSSTTSSARRASRVSPSAAGRATSSSTASR